MTLLLSSSLSSSWSLRRFLCVYTSIYIYMCVYVFFHFNCCSCFYPDRHDVYRYAILCRCRLVLFLRFFLRMFFFDSIDDRNIECFMLSLFSRSSYSLLQSTLVAYSYVFLILHLRVLFRCVPYVYFVLKRKKNASQNELFQHVCHTLR